VQLHDILMILRRRWYLVLCGVVAAAAVAYGATTQVPVTYAMQTSSVLIPGKSTILEGSNPFLFLGGLTQQRDLLTYAVMSPEVQAQLREPYPGTTLAVSADVGTSGPVLTVQATGPDPAALPAVIADANAALDAELGRMQDEVDTPRGARTSMLQLTTAAQPTTERGAQLKAMVAGAGVVMLVTLLVTAFVDGRLLARARRRGGLTEPGLSDELAESLAGDPVLPGAGVPDSAPRRPASRRRARPSPTHHRPAADRRTRRSVDPT